MSTYEFIEDFSILCLGAGNDNDQQLLLSLYAFSLHPISESRYNYIDKLQKCYEQSLSISIEVFKYIIHYVTRKTPQLFRSFIINNQRSRRRSLCQLVHIILYIYIYIYTM